MIHFYKLFLGEFFFLGDFFKNAFLLHFLYFATLFTLEKKYKYIIYYIRRYKKMKKNQKKYLQFAFDVVRWLQIKGTHKKGEVRMIDRDKELCEAVQRELGLSDREMASIIEALIEEERR